MPPQNIPDALLAEILGDVGVVADKVSALKDLIPGLQTDLLSGVEDASKKLSAAVQAAADQVTAIGRKAGQAAVTEAARASVTALVEEVALATSDLRMTTDQACEKVKKTAESASRELRSSSENVSIWRQVRYCAAASAGTAILVICTIIGVLEYHKPITACSLNIQERQDADQGRTFMAVWPFLSPEVQQAYTETVKKMSKTNTPTQN